MSVKERVRIGNMEFDIIRKDIRHMYLRVRPGSAAVEISAPYGLKLSEIEKAVLAKTDWLDAKLRAMQPHSAPDRILLWGKPHGLRLVSDAASTRIELRNGQIILHLAEGKRAEPQVAAAILDLWRKRLVLEAAEPVVKTWTKTLNLEPVRIACRRMKIRWGTCYPLRRLVNLNSGLACQHPACLELVIVHELGHFFIGHHGPQFKKWMSGHLPDWQKREKLFRYST